MITDFGTEILYLPLYSYIYAWVTNVLKNLYSENTVEPC